VKAFQQLDGTIFQVQCEPCLSPGAFPSLRRHRSFLASSSTAPFCF
jgi:hypothetical protein